MSMRLLLVVLCLLGHADAMVTHRSWSVDQWCGQVTTPPWPFAYQKQVGQTLEWKGRRNSNTQDMRHACTVFGVQSKCHHCEDMACANGTCAYQLQGVNWTALPRNIPTVTDVPWAISGAHRYDYGNTSVTRLCQLLSGGDCVSPSASDYTQCALRCWGQTSGPITALPPSSVRPPEISGTVSAIEVWSQNKSYSGDGKPQGLVRTLAGAGSAGFRDGAAAQALFSNPQDVAVDSHGVVYVADTDNHRVRRVDPTAKVVSTIAGDGVQGFTNGLGTSARFSFPTGIAVFENDSDISLFVADTGNHRIRKIQLATGLVSCFAGLCGTGVESARQRLAPAQPHAGLADGDSASSRFDLPMGIAVDLDGVVFVADTGNHLIRRIEYVRGLSQTRVHCFG